MKISKRQLKRIIREEKQRLIEESEYERLMYIRDSGDYSWRDMEYEVVDLMESMQSFPAKDVIEIMYDALDAEDRQDINFWHMMLGNGGHLYQALDGLKATADENYDPDRPMSERANRKINELGIDRMTSGDRDPRLEDHDDLTLGEETLEKIVHHLQALNDIVASHAGQQVVGGKTETEQIKALLPWAQDYLTYWRE